MENHDSQMHVIDMSSDSGLPSGSLHDDNLQLAQSDRELDRPTTTEIPSSSPLSSSPSRVSTSNSTFTGSANGYGGRIPLNSGVWILVEVIATLGQIIASIVILSLSKHENPEAPLFAWVVGYACGCAVTLPVLYWRFRNRNMGPWGESVPLYGAPSQTIPFSEPLNVSSTVAQGSHNNSRQVTRRSIRNTQISQRMNMRLNVIVDHLKMALDCFFAVWFVVGNVWIFGGHATPSDAPNLYRLCIVFLIFSCIGYALPFILCAAVCYCLPCLVRVVGFSEDFSQTKGATQESINALPTYKFNSHKDRSADNQSIKSVGVLAAGTEKERTIYGEDAVCCICLAIYCDNDELRELPCLHLFHSECIDQWLKINATCPLCKLEVAQNNRNSLSDSNTNRQPDGDD